MIAALLLSTLLSAQDLFWTLYIGTESGAVQSLKGKGEKILPCSLLAPGWCCQIKAELDDAGNMGEFGCYSMESNDKFAMSTRSGTVVILTGSLNEKLLKLVVEPTRPKPSKKR